MDSETPQKVTKTEENAANGPRPPPSAAAATSGTGGRTNVSGGSGSGGVGSDQGGHQSTPGSAAAGRTLPKPLDDQKRLLHKNMLLRQENKSYQDEQQRLRKDVTTLTNKVDSLTSKLVGLENRFVNFESTLETILNYVEDVVPKIDVIMERGPAIAPHEAGGQLSSGGQQRQQRRQQQQQQFNNHNDDSMHLMNDDVGDYEDTTQDTEEPIDYEEEELGDEMTGGDLDEFEDSPPPVEHVRKTSAGGGERQPHNIRHLRLNQSSHLQGNRSAQQQRQTQANNLNNKSVAVINPQSRSSLNGSVSRQSSSEPGSGGGGGGGGPRASVEHLLDNEDHKAQRCVICMNAEEADNNFLLTCGRCTYRVHVVCYGLIDKGPDRDSWLCDPCAEVTKSGGGTRSASRHPPCALCPIAEGPMKRLAHEWMNKFNGKKFHWAHVQCATYIEEVFFQNDFEMEPIVLDQLKVERLKKFLCYLCEVSIGAVIQCSYGECEQAFHVTCASKCPDVIIFNMYEESMSGELLTVPKAACSAHFEQALTAVENQENPPEIGGYYNTVEFTRDTVRDYINRTGGGGGGAGGGGLPSAATYGNNSTLAIEGSGGGGRTRGGGGGRI